MIRDAGQPTIERGEWKALIGGLHLSFVEMLWTYATRTARPQEAGWIAAFDLSVALAAFAIGVVALRGARLRAFWWLAWPALLFFARSPQSPRFGLEPGF